jgi:hypothetical protein
MKCVETHVTIIPTDAASREPGSSNRGIQKVLRIFLGLRHGRRESADGVDYWIPTLARRAQRGDFGRNDRYVCIGV